ncbi:MAG: glycosyltransferase [Phycisphaeraceae bacterium]|nr:glycosyltransferase [Phycisphaeraceae bacterium]
MASLRVLMLGWEFPPFITGGLGTACYGLTRAMSRMGMEVTFVLPKQIDPSYASHVRLISPGEPRPEDAAGFPTAAPFCVEPQPGAPEPPGGLHGIDRSASSGVTAEGRLSILGPLATPEPRRSESSVYGPGGLSSRLGSLIAASRHRRLLQHSLRAMDAETLERELALYEAVPEASAAPAFDSEADITPPPTRSDYEGDLIGQAERYARFCAKVSKTLDFDVIHAHDWLTYPAGLAVARLTGKPLVCHIHSTEFDRSGEHVNQPVYNIERRGMHGAVRVIAVSMLTKNLCVNRYGVSPDKIDVVYNGVDLDPRAVGIAGIEKGDRIVLYFGRITMQKGPEYFIQAAKKVLDVMDDVKFVVAGSGDQAQRMIEMAAALGIGSKVLFTGFLRGKDIQRVFSMADLYVMPSVSEPFGIAPLEAMSHRVPVLISRTSGVSEILVNALKCNFWDVSDMANKIVAVLRYPPLQNTLRDHGYFEVRGINWDGAARRCETIYRRALGAMNHAAH